MSEETTTPETPEVTTPSDNNETTKPNDERVFTQSDFDSLIAREKKKIEEKYAGHDDLKAQLEQLQKEKEEKEMAEMTELEKTKKQLEEIQAKKDELESKNKELSLSQMRDNVLNKSEFSSLPRAYRLTVKGTTEEEILESARDVLEEYKNDVKKVNPDVSFGPELGKRSPEKPKTERSDIKDLISKAGERFKVKPPAQ